LERLNNGETMNSLEFQSFIEKQLQSEKILHSYMFYGENIEEYNEQILLFLYSTIIKKDIFKEYNITKKSDYNIIREKENLYNQILSGVVEEFKILDGKEMKVQDIRNAFSSVYEKPLIIEKRIYIINNFEYLNNSSQNALLKILEEPPFYVTIILTSKTLNGILDTIKSRCQKTYLEEKIENRKIGKDTILSEVIDNKIKDDILNILENSNIMKKSQYYSKYSDIITKENIEEILNILENIIYENSMIYNSIYRIIIETRRRVKINCNFEMTKDYLILNIWDEINK
jgi:DNA polymerase III, gamma and tau subunit